VRLSNARLVDGTGTDVHYQSGLDCFFFRLMADCVDPAFVTFVEDGAVVVEECWRN